MKTYTRQSRPVLQLANAIYAGLMYRGLSASGWARHRGYRPDTVRRVIRRWAHRSGRVPRGAETRAILRDLSYDLGIQVPPGIDWRAADAVAESPRRRVAGIEEERA